MFRFLLFIGFWLAAVPGFGQSLALSSGLVTIEGQWQVAPMQPATADYLDLWHLPEAQWQSIGNSGSSLGLIQGQRWLRLHVHNQTPDNHWHWMLNNRGIRLIDVWWLSEAGELLDHFTLGSELPFNEGRLLKLPKLNHHLQLGSDQSGVLLVKVTHNGYVDMNGIFATPEEMITRVRSETLLEWMFYGIYLALLLYHCTLYFSSRDKSHLGYVLFVSSTFVFFIFVEGYLFRVFSYSPEMAYAVGQGSVPMISAAAAYFTLIYLNMQDSRWRLTFRTIIIAGITMGLLRLVWPAFPSLLLGASLGFLTFTVIPIAALQQYLRDNTEFSLPYFAAWSLWSILAVAASLAVLGAIPMDISGFWTVLKIAFAMQNILLSWSLGVRIRSLTRQHASAQAESAAKSNLIAQVSHEIRTPMNGIIGTSQLLESHIKDDQGHQLNDVIYHSSMSLLTVINDLLDLSRLEAGHFDLHAEPTDIKRLISQVMLTLGSQIKRKQLIQNVEFKPTVPKWLMVDHVRLRQILLNLTGNAIKYTEQGSITLVLDYKYPTLSICITDTGRGIPEDKISTLFQPFTQVKKDAREKRTGTGLGLHIAHSIIELMNGSIHIESEVGKGTQVRLFIPAPKATKSERQTKATLSAELASKQSLNILIADDNDINLKVLEGLLARLGHTVRVTRDGSEAVADYFEHHEDIDLILMDCEMPVLDGYKAAEKIREVEAAKHLPAVPIIAVTAHAYRGHEEQVINSGMDMQLSKPISRESIAQALQAL